MAQYKEDYKTAYELSIKSLGITKTFDNIDEVLNYHLYTLEELWALFNIAFILQKARHLNKLTPIQLYTYILNYLDRGIINYDMIRQIYSLSLNFLNNLENKK